MKNKRTNRILFVLSVIILSLSVVGCAKEPESDALREQLEQALITTPTSETARQTTAEATSPTSSEVPEQTTTETTVETTASTLEPTPPPEPTIVDFDPMEANEYYAKALQSFAARATGNVSAVLHDIDGCGRAEMILLDDGTPEDVEFWAVISNGFQVAVVDAKDAGKGPAVFEPEFITYVTHRVYVTTANNIIVSDSFEGVIHRVLRYQDGEISQEALFFDGSYGDSYYEIDGREINEDEYLDLLKKYDEESIAFTIGVGSYVDEPATLRDDFDRILDGRSF